MRARAGGEDGTSAGGSSALEGGSCCLEKGKDDPSGVSLIPSLVGFKPDAFHQTIA